MKKKIMLLIGLLCNLCVIMRAQTPAVISTQRTATLTTTQPQAVTAAQPAANAATPVLTTTRALPIVSKSSQSPLTLFKSSARAAYVNNVRVPKNFTYQSQPAEITGISNTRKFDGDSKVAFNYTLTNSDCMLIPIKMKTSTEDFGLFFPGRTFKEGIFPGAVYPFQSLINQSPAAYTRFTARNQMDLTVKIFDNRAVSGTGPVTISTFDAGTLNRQWPVAITKYPGGAAALPATTEIFTFESNRQMNVMLNTGGQIDCAARMNLRVPGIDVNITPSLVSAVAKNIPLDKMKNTVLLCFRQVYYSATVAVKSGKQDLFPDVNNSQLETDLVYVQGVDYGQAFYVAVSSEYSKQMLYAALRTKAGTYPELGLLPSSFPDNDGSLLTYQYATLSEGLSNRLLGSRSTSIACFQYDGQIINMGTTIDEVLTDLAAKVKGRFNSNTEAVPVSYSLSHAADHSPVWFNSEVCYATADCGPLSFSALKYSVKMKLVKAEVIKAVELGTDKCEELFGQMLVGKMLYTDNNDAIDVSRRGNDFLWIKMGMLDVMEACQGIPVNIGTEKVLATDIGLEKITKSQFLLTQLLYDAELLVHMKYVCKEGIFEDMIKLNTYINQIEAMPGGSTPLTIPLVLNFFEDGKANSSHVKIYWELEIKAI